MCAFSFRKYISHEHIYVYVIFPRHFPIHYYCMAQKHLYCAQKTKMYKYKKNRKFTQKKLLGFKGDSDISLNVNFVKQIQTHSISHTASFTLKILAIKQTASFSLYFHYLLSCTLFLHFVYIYMCIYMTLEYIHI